MKYFTSDPHFFHKGIIQYCNRPFKTVEEMNTTIINNWNEIVTDSDEVYLLGDVAWTGNIKAIRTLRDKLNGAIHLIMGNHDYQNKFQRQVVRDIFDSTNDYLQLEVPDDEMEGGKQLIFLCHYPMLVWNGSHRGAWQLFGHVHSGPLSTGKDTSLKISPAQYDVGVDNNDFKPVSYDQIKTIITKQYLKRITTMRQFTNNQ